MGLLSYNIVYYIAISLIFPLSTFYLFLYFLKESLLGLGHEEPQLSNGQGRHPGRVLLQPLVPVDAAFVKCVRQTDVRQ